MSPVSINGLLLEVLGFMKVLCIVYGDKCLPARVMIPLCWAQVNAVPVDNEGFNEILLYKNDYYNNLELTYHPGSRYVQETGAWSLNEEIDKSVNGNKKSVSFEERVSDNPDVCDINRSG